MKTQTHLLATGSLKLSFDEGEYAFSVGGQLEAMLREHGGEITVASGAMQPMQSANGIRLTEVALRFEVDAKPMPPSKPKPDDTEEPGGFTRLIEATERQIADAEAVGAQSRAHDLRQYLDAVLRMQEDVERGGQA